MTIYSNRRDLAHKPAMPAPRERGVIDTTGLQVKHGPAPKPEPVPALFSAARPGVDPLTGRAWSA